MSNEKISQLTPVTGTPADNLIIPAVDTNGNNLSISFAQAKAPATVLTLSGTTITAFSSSTFTQTGGVVSAIPTYPTLSGTAVTSFSSSSFTQASGVLSAIPKYPTLSGTNITSFNPSNFSQSGGVLSATSSGSGSGTALTYGGSSLSSIALSTTSFSDSSGTISVASTSFGTFNSVGSLSGSTQILVMQNGTAYSCTLAQLFAYGAPQAAPQAITINTVGAQTTGATFTVSGTLTSYSNPPFLQYCDNSGSFAVVSGTVTSTTFSFTHPALSTAGNYTVSIRDQNDVLATSNSFAVSAPAVTAASFTTQPPSSSGSGDAINYAVSLTPTGGSAYAALYKSGTQEGSRVIINGSGAGPALTPASTGSYTVEIFASSGATSALATSNTITVSVSLPTVGGVAPSAVLDASASTVYADSAYSTAQTTNGGTVLGWKDSTNNHYNFNQTSSGSGASLVTNAQNGLSGVVFHSSNTGQLNGLSSLASAMSTAADGSGITIAVSWKYSSGTGVGATTLATGSSDGSGISVGAVYGNAQCYYITIGNGSSQYVITTLPSANTLVKEIFIVSPSGLQVICNSSNSGLGGGTTRSGAYNSILLGQAGNNNCGDITIFEVDIWAGAASSGDITNIQNYLTNKWGS